MNALRDKAVRLFVGILTVCAFCASGIVRAQTAPSSTVTYTYTFSTCIDGDDFLVIQGNSIQWQYGDHTAVGDPRADCSMTATSIDTSAAGVGVLSTAWQPVWTPDPPSSGVLSSKFVGLMPSLPDAAMTVTLTPIQARYSVAIVQQPAAANNWTLVIEFNDDPISGAAIYTVEVTVTFTQPSILGTWHGSFTATGASTPTGTESFVVQSQTGSNITGYFCWDSSVNPATCSTNINLYETWTGTIDQSGALIITGQYDNYPGQVSADGNTITGTYLNRTKGYTGTWTVTKGPSILGTWHGSLADTPYPFTEYEDLIVKTQTPAGAISGTFVWLTPPDSLGCSPLPPPCITTWSGTIDGNGNILLTGQAGYAYTGALSADGNTLSGTWIQPPGLPPDYGTWTVQRGAGNDFVVLTGQGASTGLWINGLVNSVQWDHYRVGPKSGSLFDLGANVTRSQVLFGNEVVAFTDGAPPTVLPNVQWTTSTDFVPLTLRSSAPIQLTRILLTSSASAGTKAEADLRKAAITWQRERVGFTLDGGGTPIDLSGIPDAFNSVVTRDPLTLQAVANGQDCSAVLSYDAAVRANHLVGAPGIDIYYVDVAYDLTANGTLEVLNGFTCSDGTSQTVIFISMNTSQPETLVHEVGHALSLEHFLTDSANVMTCCGVPNRQFLTEGQTFDMSYDDQSALYFLYGLIGLQDTRHCLTGASGPQPPGCPRIDFRIWPDGDPLNGGFPATPNPP